MDNKLAEKVITEARVYSEKYGCIIRVLSNGKTLTWYDDNTADCNKAYCKKSGYWTVLLFENGHRVEA
ncbi:MAG: hypothetical protein ACLVBD_05205 [Hominilimicola sp.]|jgi:hypothetical protein|uniref:hypothetical protein n=1 Tax=Hominilimicola sp. TaxID=3073571 RepID=UPI003999E423